MSKSLKLNLIILGIAGLMLAGSFYISFRSEVKAQTNSINLTGYAWSDNIGWISFSSENVTQAVTPTCAPASPLTQTLTCPSGTTGASIIQTSTCLSGATSPVWIPATNPNCVTSPTCTPASPSTRTQNCTLPQTGTYTQTSTCLSGATSPTWVTNTPSTCVTSCIPASPSTRTPLCPSGQIGSITQTSTCISGAASPTWVTTSNTCLTWSGDQGSFNWSNANTTCARQGLRLPTTSELVQAMLIYHTQISFRTDLGYWSDSQAISPQWLTGLNFGLLYCSTNDKNYIGLVRCVH